MKSSILLLAVMSVFCISFDAEAQWTKVFGAYGDTVNCFTVSHNSSGSANLFAGIRRSGIFLSTNSGASWIQANNGITNNQINALATGPNSNGGTTIFAGTGDGAFISTNDGKSWTQTDLKNTYVTSFAVNSNSAGSSGAIVFAGTYGGVYLSTNYGVNWIQTGLTNINITSLAVSHNTAGSAGEAGTKILVGTSGHGVYLSTDDGTSWVQSDRNPRTDAFIIFLLVKDTTLYAGTPGYGVLFSNNNGTSWNSASYGLVYTNIFAITFVDTKLFAGTYGGGIFFTSNNGTSWTEAGLGLKNTYINAFAVIGTILFAGTHEGIWRRPISEMITGIEDRPNKIPTSFALEQNYPNPFNPVTTIKYSIPKPGHVILKVYNVLGKEVATLVNENKSAGEYNVSFNASNLTSGIYFYRITAGSFAGTKKLILLK